MHRLIPTKHTPRLHHRHRVTVPHQITTRPLHRLEKSEPTMKLTQLASIAAHPDRVWQVAPHPTLPILATASADKSSQIISLLSFNTLSTLDGGHKRTIRSIAWKPNTEDEPVLATGSFDYNAGIWRQFEDEATETKDWQFLVILEGHESEMKRVAWSAGGSFLATCSRDKSVWVWEEMDDDNFETVAVLQDHTQDVKCVAWHPEEVLLASGSYDNNIMLYKEDIDDWVCVKVLEGHESTVWSLEFEPLGSPKYSKERGSRLVSCSDDLTVKIWTRAEQTGLGSGGGQLPSILRGSQPKEEWECTATLPKAHSRSVYSVSWSKVTGRIVSCGGDGKIVVYEEAEDNEWKIVAEVGLAHGAYEINCVAWSTRYDKDKRGENDEIIISSCDDGKVNFWVLDEE
jgi:WD40 repeat protein